MKGYNVGQTQSLGAHFGTGRHASIGSAASPLLMPTANICPRLRAFSQRGIQTGVTIRPTGAAHAPAVPLYDFGIGSAQGKRDLMEDDVVAFLDNKNGRYYVGVFDGHCGFNASAWLKTELYKLLSLHLPKGALRLPAEATAVEPVRSNTDSKCVFGAALTKGFVEADRLLIAHLRALGALGEGSTATAAIISPGASIVVAHVGDSQAVLCRQGGAISLTTPHRVSGISSSAMAERARVEAAGGWVDDDRVCGLLAVSRALGDYEYKSDGLSALLQRGVDGGHWDEAFAARQTFVGDPVVALPEVTETLLTPGDEFLILASDGLWDAMPPEKAVRWARTKLREQQSASSVAAGLVDMALKRHSADNVSVVVVDLVGSSFKSSPRGPSNIFTHIPAFFKVLLAGSDK